MISSAGVRRLQVLHAVHKFCLLTNLIVAHPYNVLYSCNAANHALEHNTSLIVLEMLLISNHCPHSPSFYCDN